MKKKVLLALFSLCLVACSTVTREQLATADYGRYPDNYAAIIKQYFDETLLDPSSAMYRGMTTPQKWYYDGGGLTENVFGYVVCVSVNAKNTYGGYTGFTPYALLVRNGNIVRYQKAEDGLPLKDGCR